MTFLITCECPVRKKKENKSGHFVCVFNINTKLSTSTKYFHIRPARKPTAVQMFTRSWIFNQRLQGLFSPLESHIIIMNATKRRRTKNGAKIKKKTETAETRSLQIVRAIIINAGVGGKKMAFAWVCVRVSYVRRFRCRIV